MIGVKSFSLARRSHRSGLIFLCERVESSRMLYMADQSRPRIRMPRHFAALLLTCFRSLRCNSKLRSAPDASPSNKLVSTYGWTTGNSDSHACTAAKGLRSVLPQYRGQPEDKPPSTRVPTRKGFCFAPLGACIFPPR